MTITNESILDWNQLILDRLNGQPLPDLPARIQVPRPPQCIAEFLRLVDQPETPMINFADLIEKDAEITSSVLRIVNGSQLMLREKISSIARAIGIVGLQRCKMLVMSAAIQSSMATGTNSNKQLGHMILESQERAMFARQVALHIGCDAEIAYVSALLQDLLLPQLATVQSDFYDAFHSEIGTLVNFERERNSYDHSIYTSALLSKWNFADEIIACVSMHHEHRTILQKEELLHSVIAAVAMSALLPGVIDQEPQGISLLMQYQQAIPGFDFLQVAADVDEEIATMTEISRLRVPLADRLSRLAMAAIHQRSDQQNWVERSLGNYTLEEQIGQGGMGVVYRARHSMLRRPAAVKMLKSSTLSPAALKRFEAEAYTTSELSSPHTVQKYDYGMTPDGALYYVMEYLEGMSLSELVQLHGPLPEGRIIHILCQVCGSLAEAHDKGLIHRDIKAENVALTVCAGAHDFAKVLDFGLVAVKDELPGQSGKIKIMGTPAYMSPESIQAPELVDERSDIYAVGAVAYYCLTGKILFENRTLMEILKAQLEELPDFEGVQCSPELNLIIMQCLEKSPQDRPQSMIELAQKLAACPSASSWTFDSATKWWKDHPETIDQASESELNVSTMIIDQEFHLDLETREMLIPENIIAAEQVQFTILNDPQ